MTNDSSAALSSALAYHEAWTSKDLARAMTYVAEEIVCEAPGGRVSGAGPYRQFLANFVEKLTGVEMIAAFGDGEVAVLMYYPHTALVTDAPTAECFTVSDGKDPAEPARLRPSFVQPTGPVSLPMPAG